MPQIWAESVEQHKRQTRSRIIQATLALVAERGLGATSMSQIAERVGVGRATLYGYFPDVEHVLLAWHDEEVDRYCTSLADQLASEGDAVSSLQIFLTRLLEGFSDDHDQALDASRVALSALSPNVKRQMGHATAKLASLLTGVLKRGVRDHQLRADLDIELTTALIMRMATAARETMAADETDPKHVAQTMLALLLGGIQAPLPEGRANPRASPPS